MGTLSHTDVSRLLATVEKVHCHEDFSTLPRLMVDLTTQLVPNDFCAYTLANRQGELLEVAHDRPDILSDIAKLSPQLTAFYHEHPVVQHYDHVRKLGVKKISDFLTQRNFERLGLYNEFYKPLDAHHQVVSYLSNDNLRGQVIACNRSSQDFSARDLAVLDLIRPHFARAWHNGRRLQEFREWETRTHEALATTRCGLLFLDESLKIERLTANCEDWLNRYFRCKQNNSVRLPEELRRWVSRQLDFKNAETLADQRVPLVVAGAAAVLTVHCVRNADNKVILLLHEHPRSKKSERVFHPLAHLSARQNEVLQWMVEGKRNREIGVILGISERTVEKHVAEIFNVLHVENRAATIRKALEWKPAEAA